MRIRWHLLLSPNAFYSLLVLFSLQQIGCDASNRDPSGNTIRATSTSSIRTKLLERRRQLRDEDLFGSAITRYPSKEPTSSPTISPTPQPTEPPSTSPTTAEPTTSPSVSPTTAEPTVSPTESPTTAKPTTSPSDLPTESPTTAEPTAFPSVSPTTTYAPTKSPTWSPTTAAPTMLPSSLPSASRFPSLVPSETRVPSGAPTRSIPISTLFVLVYTSNKNAIAIASCELENILEIHLLDQFRSEWPDAMIVQLKLLLEAAPDDGSDIGTETGEEAFMLSGQLICNHESCPSTELTNFFILHYLSNNVDQILMDPMLESVIGIDISEVITPDPKSVAEANQYESLPDDLFNTWAIMPLLTASILTAAILCIGASVFCIRRTAHQQNHIADLVRRDMVEREVEERAKQIVKSLDIEASKTAMVTSKTPTAAPDTSTAAGGRSRKGSGHPRRGKADAKNKKGVGQTAEAMDAAAPETVTMLWGSALQTVQNAFGA